MPAPLVFVHFTLFDYVANMEKSLSLSNLALAGCEPALLTPVEIRTQIDFNMSSSPSGRLATAGTVKFLLNEATRPSLGYRWLGSIIEIREGDEGEAAASLDTVFVGLVTDMSHDGYEVTVQVTDNRLLLDKPLVNDFYPDTALAALVGLPRPHLFGTRNSIEPVLEDEDLLRYRVSVDATGTLSISELRVGGVPWDFVSANPEPGQYTYGVPSGVPNGCFDLGGVPGGEIRVDASTDASLTTAGLLNLLVIWNASITNNPPAQAALDVLRPWPVGFYTGTTPINVQDALDRAAGPQLAWWGITPDTGILDMGALELPVANSNLLTSLDVGGARETGQSPRPWRVTVEYSANEDPASQFYDSVSDSQQQLLSATGITVQYEAPGALVTDPMSIDMPTIRSLLTTEADAIALRDLAYALWTDPSRGYEIEAERTDLSLNDPVDLDYLSLQLLEYAGLGAGGNFRVYGILRRYGGDRPSVYTLRTAPALSASSGS